jgi:hypothetical protein
MQNPESSMAESPKRVQSAYNADKFMSEERFSGFTGVSLKCSVSIWSSNDFECNP